MIDILFSLAGLVILVKGKVNITEKRAITGARARYLGGLFIICFPLGYFLRIYIFNANLNLLYGFIYPALLIIITIIFVLLSKKNSIENKTVTGENADR